MRYFVHFCACDPRFAYLGRIRKTCFDMVRMPFVLLSLTLLWKGVPTDGTEYPDTGCAYSASKLYAALAGVTRNPLSGGSLTEPSWFVEQLSKSPDGHLNFGLGVLISGKEIRYLMA